MSAVLTQKYQYVLSIFILFLSILTKTPVFAESMDTSAHDPVTSLRCNIFTFDASKSYDPDNKDLNFLWDFGDGQSSTEAVATYTYQRSGDYKVTLTVADNSGLHCSTAETSQIVRVNIPPHAEFTAPREACVNTPVEFDGGASHDDSKTRLRYNWNFGDGAQQQSKHRVEKIYHKAGDYTVALTVNDNSDTVCQSQTVESQIHINAAPIAQAGEPEILKCVSDDEEVVIAFDGSNSSDANNNPLRFYWDFGDGNSAEGMKVSHRYTDIGNYDTKLIVKDDSNLVCSSGVDFVRVRINKAPVAHAGDDIIACPGERISFDGSASQAYRKGTIDAQWFFGDGSSAQGLVVSHEYQKPGKYQASIAVENKLNAMCPPSRDTRNVTINAMPSVSIKTVKAACLGNTVHFDASSADDPDGDSLEYYWSFGDGEILRAGAKVSHTYHQGGDYRVSVIVDDGQKSPCSTATAKAMLKINTPPVADAGPNTSCCVDLATRFDAGASIDADGDPLTYTWDFGDGVTQQGAIAEHVYAKSGTYNVQVTVDDNSGTVCSQSTAGFVAEANAAPVPVFQIR